LSFNYSAFNLRALLDLASLGQNAGVDLWHYQTADGRSIRRALEYLAPYSDPAREWPHQQIHRPDRGALASLLMRAVPVYPRAGFEGELKFFNPAQLYADGDRLLFKTAELHGNPPAPALGQRVPGSTDANSE